VIRLDLAQHGIEVGGKVLRLEILEIVNAAFQFRQGQHLPKALLNVLSVLGRAPGLNNKEVLRLGLAYGTGHEVAKGESLRRALHGLEELVQLHFEVLFGRLQL